jgi:hypothetical protein
MVISNCRYLILAFCTALLISAVVQAQCNPGLHAGIRADFVPMTPAFTEPPVVSLSFLLVNDSNSTIDVAPQSWRILIDGNEISDPLQGNGPVPTEGWVPLSSGQNHQLGARLNVFQYFPHPGEYKITWKGRNFQSPTISITIPPDAYRSTGSVNGVR